ncbi:unnamed protein product [Protopolystoma xenopodis]|uniref:Vinculin n=1 Tax=Protopolystoma xenopodis TaxID=117903 RepID=A0A3S4ZR93_9PLAT|nr:unnamed protein product [Protopolystoma xenopodis]
MPPSLVRVEDACILLQEAVRLFNADSTSAIAKKKLIDGSRGILQGTSSVLLTVDMSEVRKIIGYCRSVLEMLASAEVVNSLSSLAEFVKI